MGGRLRGDGEDDDIAGDTRTIKFDADGDRDNDTVDLARHDGYRDGDDGSVVSFGRLAGRGVEGVLRRLVVAYLAAGVKDDGGRACSLIESMFANALPEDYGRSPGPLYLRGASTCAAVLSLTFKHEQAVFSGSWQVTGARVDGARAYVLLGSTTQPASYMVAKREHRAWKLLDFLPKPLP